MSSNSLAAAAKLMPPHGLDQIITTFGDIFAHIGPDHALDLLWETDSLARVKLPFPMKLSWDQSRTVTWISCHKLVAGIFPEVFRNIQSAGLQKYIASFGGCFAFRPQRTGTKLSTHAWGIAIDLNPESNMQGTAGNMNVEVIKIFRQAGFTWGGDWQGKTRDPMHFQFCTGY